MSRCPRFGGAFDFARWCQEEHGDEDGLADYLPESLAGSTDSSTLGASLLAAVEACQEHHYRMLGVALKMSLASRQGLRGLGHLLERLCVSALAPLGRELHQVWPPGKGSQLVRHHARWRLWVGYRLPASS
eukprot:g15390.t1